MLSERPWKVEAVAGLLAALMLALYAAGLINLHLAQVLPGKSLLGNRFFQFVFNTFAFQGLGLVLIHFFLKFHGVGWGELLGLNTAGPKVIVAGVAAALAALPVALLLNSVCAALLTKIHVQPVEQEPMQVLQVSVSLGQRIVFAAGAIVLAPIVEECLFRGILYPTIKKEGYPRLALFGSSFLFALIHFNLMTFIPLFVLALILVLLLEITNTLLSTIVAHACFNAANFFIYLNADDLTRRWHEFTHSLRHVLPM
jgi:membrane protease YdiL (CAAX protease family)